jgi:hypothetical protein
VETYSELSKVAQEQTLAAVKQGQGIAVQSAQFWAELVKPYAEQTPPLPVPAGVPSPAEAVTSGFAFAEKLLASQKQFADDLAAAWTPVAEAWTKKPAKKVTA